MPEKIQIKQKCRYCDNILEPGAQYCDECGKKCSDTPPEPKPPQNPAYCPKCGKQVEAGVKACPECIGKGTPLTIASIAIIAVIIALFLFVGGGFLKKKEEAPPAPAPPVPEIKENHPKTPQIQPTEESNRAVPAPPPSSTVQAAEPQPIQQPTKRAAAAPALPQKGEYRLNYTNKDVYSTKLLYNINNIDCSSHRFKVTIEGSLRTNGIIPHEFRTDSCNNDIHGTKPKKVSYSVEVANGGATIDGNNSYIYSEDGVPLCTMPKSITIQDYKESKLLFEVANLINAELCR